MKYGHHSPFFLFSSSSFAPFFVPLSPHFSHNLSPFSSLRLSLLYLLFLLFHTHSLTSTSHNELQSVLYFRLTNPFSSQLVMWWRLLPGNVSVVLFRLSVRSSRVIWLQLTAGYWDTHHNTLICVVILRNRLKRVLLWTPLVMYVTKHEVSNM